VSLNRKEYFQRAVLRALAQNRDYDGLKSAVGAALDRTPSRAFAANFSRVLRVLERRGWIETERDCRGCAEWVRLTALGERERATIIAREGEMTLFAERRQTQRERLLVGEVERLRIENARLHAELARHRRLPDLARDAAQPTSQAS
jgi:DNA-binding MarR family transcriptional regulator